MAPNGGDDKEDEKRPAQHFCREGGETSQSREGQQRRDDRQRKEKESELQHILFFSRWNRANRAEMPEVAPVKRRAEMKSDGPTAFPAQFALVMEEARCILRGLPSCGA
jgi:hypothetical protein